MSLPHLRSGSRHRGYTTGRGATPARFVRFSTTGPHHQDSTSALDGHRSARAWAGTTSLVLTTVTGIGCHPSAPMPSARALGHRFDARGTEKELRAESRRPALRLRSEAISSVTGGVELPIRSRTADARNPQLRESPRMSPRPSGLKKSRVMRIHSACRTGARNGYRLPMCAEPCKCE